MKTNEHQLFLDGDSGHAYENELFPNQHSDYPMAADGTGGGDPEWQKEYEKYRLEHSSGKSDHNEVHHSESDLNDDSQSIH